MKEYIILVAVSAIIAAFADVLAPEGWRGYTRVIMGFLILSVLISPVAKLKKVEIFSEAKTFSVSDTAVKKQVVEELSRRVEDDICQRISSEFGSKVKAEVELLVDEENRIGGVRRIVLMGKDVPPKAKERLREVYGCNSVEIRIK